MAPESIRRQAISAGPCDDRSRRTGSARRRRTHPGGRRGEHNGSSSGNRVHPRAVEHARAAVLRNGGHRGVVRVLPSPDGGDGTNALGLDPPPRPARAGIRVRNLRGGRQHPPPHPRHGAPDPHGDRPHPRGPSHVRRRLPRGGGRGGALLPCGRRPSHRRPARRPSRGRCPLRAAPRRLRPRGRSRGRASPHRRLRGLGRRLPRSPPGRPEPAVRRRQPQTQAGRGSEPRHHPVLLRHGAVPSLP